MSDLTILVTGGAGFIGVHLCEYLLRNNNQVFCVDNLLSGRINNICYLQKLFPTQFTFINEDVINLTIGTFREDIKFDQIYHLACSASPKWYQSDPIHTLRTCFEGTRNMLEIARIHNARFLITSTSEVYGDPEVSPQNELYRGNVNIIGPRACYDEGKRVAETLTVEYHKFYNVSVRIARLFNTYGPKMDANDGRVVSNFITQALRGEDITVYGDGSQTRSFCFINDTVEALVRWMNVITVEIGPINIGNPYEITIMQLADIITTRLNTKIKYCPLPVDDPMQRKPDIGNALRILDWTPEVPLNRGIELTIEYFSNQE